MGTDVLLDPENPHLINFFISSFVCTGKGVNIRTREGAMQCCVVYLAAGGLHPVHPIGEIICQSDGLLLHEVKEGRPT